MSKRRRRHGLPPTDEGGLRYVYVELPTCPKCGGVELRSYHTDRSEPGVVQRHMDCLNPKCLHAFILVLEKKSE